LAGKRGNLNLESSNITLLKFYLSKMDTVAYTYRDKRLSCLF
jgi:hypothetical protein